ncbi:MAG: hypothetical protein J5764_02680 [Bacteroidales bacterium]|nr:hypothetical protein [Bacteroidales bacterium]
MKRFLAVFVSVLALLGFSLDCTAQARLYTRKFILENFSTVILKVVPSGNKLLDLCLKDAIYGNWNISPYEICDPDDFDALHADPSNYILCIVSIDGLVYLSLDKGGKQGDKDALKRPMNVARLPIATREDFGSRSFSYLPAWIDMLQEYVSEASAHEKTAYLGLGYHNKWPLPEEYTTLEFIPRNPGRGTVAWRIVYDQDTHVLYRYTRLKFDGSIFK